MQPRRYQASSSGRSKPNGELQENSLYYSTVPKDPLELQSLLRIPPHDPQSFGPVSSRGADIRS